MKINKLLIALTVAIFSTFAMADEEINYSVSIKDWYHTLRDDATSSRINAVVMSGTAKKGDYFATLSMLLPSNYYHEDGTYLTRRDTDLALGWSVNSNVAVLGGVKKIGSNNFNFSGSTATASPSTFNISYLGLNGFTSVSEKSFLYGTATKSLKVTKSNQPTASLTLTTYDVGYGYVLNKSTQLSLGYRSQVLRNDGSNTTLSGFIFGSSFNF